MQNPRWSTHKRVPVHQCGPNFIPANSVVLTPVRQSVVVGDAPLQKTIVMDVFQKREQLDSVMPPEDMEEETEESIDYPEEEEEEEGIDWPTKEEIVHTIAETTANTVEKFMIVEGTKILLKQLPAIVEQLLMPELAKARREQEHKFCGNCEICGYKEGQ